MPSATNNEKGMTCGYTILVCNQPLWPTQHPTLSGTGNKYTQRSSALQSGRQPDWHCNDHEPQNSV